MSWLDKESVERLRNVYNKEHPKETPIPSGSPQTVWNILRTRLRDKCGHNGGDAECIVTTLTKKPKAPEDWKENPMEWLSSDDIDKKEKEFEKVFEGYKYIATVPMDFDLKSETQHCIVSALCKMKLPELYKKGFDKFGIIVNTDYHDGPGQHWVAVYCDIRSDLDYPRMTYFDSYAKQPEPEIQELMQRWKEQWDATSTHGKGMELTYNKTRHQFKESECGMYCLYFHRACLMEIPMDVPIKDDIMNEFRKVMFKV